jgi:hypothetical protein
MVDKEDISEMRDSKEYPDDEIDPGKEQAINDLKERYDMLKEDTWNMTGVAAISVEHHQQEYEMVLRVMPRCLGYNFPTLKMTMKMKKMLIGMMLLRWKLS